MQERPRSFEVALLARAYQEGSLRPGDVLDEVYRRIDAAPREIWIERVPRQAALSALADAEQRKRAGRPQPLFGIPFAIKDNIDVANLPTTAGCPAFSRVARTSATVVQRLLDAGGVLVGKTNMDQFATGLVGTRSPYGACASAFDVRYIAGGSSSGSALCVALGITSFALGTDTAGSGRVPAAFNNVVGYKPTRGLLSTAGVVPACRSLDCVSVFAASASDALTVARVASGYDPCDPYSRSAPAESVFATAFRFGVPPDEQLEFFGDEAASVLYQRAIERLETLGGKRVVFDFEPFRQAAELLYAGPWLAERIAALGPFLAEHPNDVDRTVAEVLRPATSLSAVDVFQGMYRLRELEVSTQAAWSTMDFMLLPTTGTTYTLDAVQRDPIGTNATLGYYTNFVNLLDLAAAAVPAGFRESGLPFGVSVIGRAFDDVALLRIADAFHRAQRPRIGSTSERLAEDTALPRATHSPGGVALAVVGAHLSGQPLHHELLERGARLLRTSRTLPCYRLFALKNTEPEKPALVKEPDFVGAGIEAEVWELPNETIASFLAGIPSPLGIGTVTLEDGSQVQGFICERHALAEAEDITPYGSWRAYMLSRRIAGQEP